MIKDCMIEIEGELLHAQPANAKGHLQAHQTEEGLQQCGGDGRHSEIEDTRGFAQGENQDAVAFRGALNTRLP